MSNRSIIDKAACIVQCKFEDIDANNTDYVELSKNELLSISAALAIAGAMCRESGKEG